MASRPNIILIGYMGSGKSSVGTELAKIGKFHFTDTDTLIEEAVGKSIPEIFDTQGEAFFRTLETKICARLEDYENTVISTGGGIIMMPENRRLLQQAGYIVHLDAPLSVLEERIPKDGSRPLAVNPVAFRKRFDERKPWYAALAQVSIDTARLSIAQVADDILDLYNKKYSPA